MSSIKSRLSTLHLIDVHIIFCIHSGGEEVGPQISADLEGIEDEEIHHIDFHRDENGFGFSIRGGAEYNSHLFVLRLADNGAADKDGNLKVCFHFYQIDALRVSNVGW